MGSLAFAIAIAIVVLVSGLIGLKLRALLPDEHGPDKARDMIGAMTGLIGLLLALVLGTLVGSSYTIYATQKSELDAMSAKVLQLDEALGAYGPEAAPGREGLRRAIQESYDKIWGTGDADFSTALSEGCCRGREGPRSIPAFVDAKNRRPTPASDPGEHRSGPHQSDALADAISARRQHFLADAGNRHVLVSAAVLRLWPDLVCKPYDDCDADAGRPGGRQRALSDPGLEPALQGVLPDTVYQHRDAHRRHGRALDRVKSSRGGASRQVFQENANSETAIKPSPRK